MLAAVPKTPTADERAYQQVVDGGVVHIGILPAELVRGHPYGHPESQMHGGLPAGESHITVALFEEKTGKRLTDADVTARISGERGFEMKKNLEPMLIAGNQTYGSCYKSAGAARYRIELMIGSPSAAGEIRASITWAWS